MADGWALRGYSLIFIGFYAVAIVAWIALSHGLIDPNSKPIGIDFSNVYAAGTLIWRGAAFELKASALATASLLATPYVRDYDLTVLAVAIAFFVRHGLQRGFHGGEITVLVAAWVVPLLTRSVAGIPLGLIVMLALYALTLRRAAHDFTGCRVRAWTRADVMRNCTRCRSDPAA